MLITFNDTNPTLNTNYQFVVKAIGSNGKESYNSEVHIAALLDDDLDGMADSRENYYGLDVTIDDSGIDSDNDGKPNFEEYQASTDPSGDNTGGDNTGGDNTGGEETSKSSGGAMSFYFMLIMFSLALDRMRKITL